MTGTNLHLRAAAPSDARAIAALLTELGHPTAAADVPARLTAVLNDHGAAFVVVDRADTPLGFMSMSRHVTLHSPGPIAYITALVTSSAARRRGVGKMLVEHAKRWAAEQGCVRLSVTSAERRADAHAFYPASGLPYTGRRFAMEIAPTK